METFTFLLKLLIFVAVWGIVLYFFAWALVHLATRYGARRALRGDGGPSRCVPWVAGISAVFIFLAIGFFAFLLLAPAVPDAKSSDGTGLIALVVDLLNQVLSGVGWAVVTLIGPIKGVLTSVSQWQVIRRRETLKVDAAPLDHQDTALPAGRRIVICCDGTGNRPDRTDGGRPATTNVYKLFAALEQNEEQVVLYDPGVATDTSSASRHVRRVNTLANMFGVSLVARVAQAGTILVRFYEAVTGSGVTENVTDAYRWLVQTYRPGDLVYLIGFSRGAWTVRCLAGVIKRCGVLKPENIRFAGDVVHFFKTRADPDHSVVMRADVSDMSARVHFLGVFDTVAALGVPLWGWWFKLPWMSPKGSWTKSAVDICDHVYHAVSMDERRSQYFVTLFDETTKPSKTTLEQVWFRGDHSDIGGGRAETELSDIAFEWMLGKAIACTYKLAFEQSRLPKPRSDALGIIHDELVEQPNWRVFGSWPRWFPAQRRGAGSSGFGTLHDTVHDRASKLETLGRIDRRFLDEASGPDVEIDVPGNAEWFRSGVVLEGGNVYRITWLRGKWRNGNDPECGPAGEALPWIRRQYPNLPRILMPRCPIYTHDQAKRTEKTQKEPVPRMTLIATHAHPQAWPPREEKLRALFQYVVRKDPDELVGQLAPIGKDLNNEGSSVCLQIGSDIPAGMLWLFANDIWVAACDNSGAVRLRIERIDTRDPGQPLWTLAKDKPTARWRRDLAEAAQ